MGWAWKKLTSNSFECEKYIYVNKKIKLFIGGIALTCHMVFVH
jgi:hypothetical protein